MIICLELSDSNASSQTCPVSSGHKLLPSFMFSDISITVELKDLMALSVGVETKCIILFMFVSWWSHVAPSMHHCGPGFTILSCCDIHGCQRMNPKGLICDSICSLTAVRTHVPSVANKVLFLSQDQGQTQMNLTSRIMFFLNACATEAHIFTYDLSELLAFMSLRKVTDALLVSSAYNDNGWKKRWSRAVQPLCEQQLVMLQLYTPRHVQI